MPEVDMTLCNLLKHLEYPFREKRPNKPICQMKLVLFNNTETLAPG